MTFNSYTSLLNQENFSSVASTSMALVDLSDIIERERRVFMKDSNMFEIVGGFMRFNSTFYQQLSDVSIMSVGGVSSFH